MRVLTPVLNLSKLACGTACLLAQTWCCAGFAVGGDSKELPGGRAQRDRGARGDQRRLGARLGAVGVPPSCPTLLCRRACLAGKACLMEAVVGSGLNI